MQFSNFIPEPFNKNYNSNAKSASIMAAYSCEINDIYESQDMEARAKIYGEYYEYYLNKEITEEELEIAREVIA
jgi:hypothetical protein